MIKYMLDTNICIYVIKKRPIEILDKFNKHASQLSMSIITFAELIHGVEKSQQIDKNYKVIEDFCSRLEILTYGDKAALHYGIIRAELEKKGMIIGVNDLHIAAHAISEGLSLITNNEREFKRVNGLKIETWLI